MRFEIKPAYQALEQVRELFSEYTDMLLALEEEIAVYLRLQSYDGELENPNGKYGLPDGRLFLAYAGCEAAGCIALRRMSGTECEMKRLYVRPAFRGNGIAKAMVSRLIDEAGAAGYRHMLLDTLPAMKDAIALYEAAGFYRIPAYNNSPIRGTVFMRLDLNKEMGGEA